MTSFQNGCRKGCAACCIVPSISSSMPGMPNGKPAHVPCAHLTADLRCELFGRRERPAVCSSLKPTREMCACSAEEATAYLAKLEKLTAPRASSPVESTTNIETND